MIKITVFMSTYNGAKFLEEQIDSILKQERVSVELVVRDDGSSDITSQILEKYNGDIIIIKGENIGCENSFLKLLYSNYISDYYAFSDQDDVWEKNKLITAIENIEKTINDNEIPSLYACNLLACDEKMNPVRLVYSETQINLTLKKSKRDFLCNMHGCTLVWNRSLQNVIHKYKPQKEIAHDVWVCVIANAVGKFIIDKEKHIFYRLHENNVSGVALSWWGRLKKGIRIYWGDNHPKKDEIAREVLAGYSDYMDCKSSGYYTLAAIADYKSSISNKIKLINKPYIKDYPWMERLFWILSIVFNKF